MKKLAIILFIMICILTGCIIDDFDGYSIIDKYESDGRCYLNLEVEVTPEEYIGYDIGDEYTKE